MAILMVSPPESEPYDKPMKPLKRAQLFPTIVKSTLS